MARQGLMDDAGYDFFDVSDCANYESCREDAYKDGYADAIDECIRKLAESEDTILSDRQYYTLQELKEQKNDI